MASEESSSPTGSPSVDSYIGSVISLTSKSEIRYEGVLVSINTQESTIALQNVKSYGTEGRRKDKPQVPASEKVYEYILFRGTDIKDLQVKSITSSNTQQQTYNDPAIIQSHYAHSPPATTPPASVGGAALTGGNSNAARQDIARQPFPDTYSLYNQTGGHPSTWPSSASLPKPDGPLNSQGYIGTSSGQAHAQPQSIPFHPHSSSSQIPLQNPESFAPRSPPNFPQTLPSQPVISNLSNSSSLLSNNTSLTSHLPTMHSFASSNQELNSMSLISSKVGHSQMSHVPVSSMPFSTSSFLGSASGPMSAPSPLLTPEQLTHLIPTGAAASLHKFFPEPKDMGSFIPSSMNSSSAVSGMPQEPLLPLPRHQQQGERGATRFTDEFDFMTMNEKFNKDEVWGSLGKEKQKSNTGVATYDDPSLYNVEINEGYVQDTPKPESKPVYNKDDFFDTISCNSLNRGGWGGRTRSYERKKLDTETFGEFEPRAPTGYGYRGRGSYNRGRGYGGYYYGGRGRGGYGPTY